MVNSRFECIRPCEEDARLIFQWRNDPVTLAMSMDLKLKEWKTFYPQFLDDYFAYPTLPPLFILGDGQRVGYILFRQQRHPFSLHRSCADISICVGPESRLKGYATQALIDLTSWLEKRDVDDILAEIKVQNEGSIRAFKAAGYEFIDTIDEFVYLKRIPLHRYVLNVRPDFDREQVMIIAEAGSNWKAGTPIEDEERAKKMIEVAAEAGADAIKFQTFRAESIYTPKAGLSDYLSEAGIHDDIGEIIRKNEMPYDMIPKLAQWCREADIEFMSSVFSSEDFAAVDPHVKRHKLASYEISHIHLIEEIAQSGKPLILSTGASQVYDISWALDIFYKNGGDDVTLMQCTAKYPAPLESLHLKTIPMLKARYHVPVGLSDHSLPPFTGPMAAVALGARVIEKHFTLDRSFEGPDHAYALEPDDLKLMVTMIRETEKVLGDGYKRLLPEEEELYLFARRRLQATQDIQEGDVLIEDENFAILRPGKQSKGDLPKHLGEIEGKKATKNIEIGEGIRLEDVE
ncbi:MAG: Spore coat polysaccharide biosynthesis protein SpsE [Chlamydiae bacterium]|nr:Spore coat polysaccharide biosynthesis protein SpsE [Chlamydiota bacterium]